MIYQAAEPFATLLEQAGLTQSETAAQADVNRHHLAHVVAGRRNVSGALAARIAGVYAARVGVTPTEALGRLFMVVRERKNTTSRPRGASGRFVKAGSDANGADTAPKHAAGSQQATSVKGT